MGDASSVELGMTLELGTGRGGGEDLGLVRGYNWDAASSSRADMWRQEGTGRTQGGKEAGSV